MQKGMPMVRERKNGRMKKRWRESYSFSPGDVSPVMIGQERRWAPYRINLTRVIIRSTWRGALTGNSDATDCRLIFPGDVLRIPKR